MMVIIASNTVPAFINLLCSPPSFLLYGVEKALMAVTVTENPMESLAVVEASRVISLAVVMMKGEAYLKL